MVTEMITVKLDNGFLSDIDSVVKEESYQNRTEFIRNALREKVEESKLKQAMIELSHLKWASKKKTTDKELHAIRDKVFREFEKKLN